MLSENRKLHEGLTEQIKTIENTHQMKLEKLRMEFAIEHSNSKVAELNGKVTSNELIIRHLKGQLEESKVDKEKLEHTKVKCFNYLLILLAMRKHAVFLLAKTNNSSQ